MSLFRRNKNNNKPIIRQINDLIPNHILSKSINRFKSDKYCHKYKTYDSYRDAFVFKANMVISYFIIFDVTKCCGL